MKQLIEQLSLARRTAERELDAIKQAIRALHGTRKPPVRPKRRITPAGRRAISKAQKARWAKARKGK